MLFPPGGKRIPPLQGKSRRRETVELKHVHVVIMFAEGCVYWNVLYNFYITDNFYISTNGFEFLRIEFDGNVESYFG